MFGNSMMMGGGIKPAPFFVANSILGVGNSLTYPAGIQAGDLLIFQTSRLNNLTIPSGWTNYGVSIPQTWTSGTLTTNYGAIWRIANGTESGTINFTYGGSTPAIRHLLSVYRNVASHAAFSGVSVNTTGGHTFPSLTATQNNFLIAYMALLSGDTTIQNLGGIVSAELDNETLRMSERSTAGDGGGVYLLTAERLGAGTIPQVSADIINLTTNSAVWPFAVVLTP